MLYKDVVIDFLCTTLFPNFIQLICRIPVNRLYLQAEWKTDVDPDQLASQKPADLDLNCFRNRIIQYILNVSEKLPVNHIHLT